MKGYFPKRGFDDRVRDVSLIELIAQPERFDGERIRFLGFFTPLFEGTAIYLHREDFDHGISRNAVWIDIPADMTNQQFGEVGMGYVICVGVFRAAHRGHMNMFSGAVTDVERLESRCERSLSADAPGSHAFFAR